VRIEAHKLPLQLLKYDRAHLQSLTQFAYGPGNDTRVRVNVEKDGRTYDNVASVNAIRKAKAAKNEGPDANERDEEEFANLPI
jgi:hypothetical protein